MRTALLQRARATATLALAAALASSPAAAQVTPPLHEQGAVGLGLALRHLAVDGGVLYVTAHPDDENNGLMVMLNRGRGLRTALLTVTRGDGGQNEIGPELFQALGIVRTEELERVHRFDGADQFYTRAFEFGYSFSVEETLQKWGKDAILGDVVRVIRLVRPDVIITMPREGPGGGQHHQTTARLAHEAFRAAADPARFPEQIREGLRPWQAHKVYMTAGGGPGDGGRRPGSPGTVAMDYSGFDPLLGVSWQQFGALARASHRSQGMTQLGASPGTGRSSFTLVDAEPAVTPPEDDLLAGIDTSLRRLARCAAGQERAFPTLTADLDAITADAERAAAAFHALAPHRTLPALAAGLARVRQLRDRVTTSGLSADARHELAWRLARKEQDFVRALTLAQGLVVHLTADDGDVVRGQTFAVTASVHNAGREPVRVDDVRLRVPDGWLAVPAGGAALPAGGAPRTLGAGESLSLKYDVTVGTTAPYSQPYWRVNPAVDRYDIEDPASFPMPWSLPDVVGLVSFTAAGAPATLEAPAHHRYEGPWVGGEKQKIVNVVPALSVELTPGIAVVPLRTASARREFRVRILNNTQQGTAAAVRLEVPEGWRVEPSEAALEFRLEGEEITTRFFVTPPPALAEGTVSIAAVATSGNHTFREGYQVIAYDHTQARHLFHPAVSRVQLIDVAVAPDLEVGYIMGGGDEVPAALAQLGVPGTLLTPEDVAYADLSRFSTIVTGIRAYEKRPDLRAHHQRLLDFARHGGHLVVQYNKVGMNWLGGEPPGYMAPLPDASPYVPYPGVITTDRVTVEEAPVEVLAPMAPLLTTPNHIGDRDWANWRQERGLYFFGAKDERYTDLLASADPWEKNPGVKRGLLTVAPIGEGSWTYVGLGLWRQLPAGTPGAYRLLANLISRPRGLASTSAH